MDHSIRNHIRRALMAAQQIEVALSRFNLSGRGREPRVKLGRSLAATVRDLELARIHIAGYGAKYRYPRRVFERAERMLRFEGLDQVAEALRGEYSESVG